MGKVAKENHNNVLKHCIKIKVCLMICGLL